MTGWPQGVPGAPVEALLADLDEDGNREIIYGETSWYMYVRRGDGSLMPGWSYKTDEGTSSIVTVGKLINEEKMKIVGNMEGDFYIWNYDGSVYQQWHYLDKVSSKQLGYVTFAPILTDIDNDGIYEIVCALDKLYAWENDGSLVKGFPYEMKSGSFSGVSIGDVDGDGHLEIVVGDGAGWVHCIKGDGTSLKGWPIKTEGVYPEIDTSAVIGDLDGDGDMEILITEGLYAILYAWHHDGTEVENFNTSNYRGGGTSTLCDLNQDGNLDILYGTGLEVYALTTNTAYNPENIEWPMFHHDKFRTGNYNSPLLNSPKNKTSFSNTTPELVIWNAENFNYDVFTYNYSFYVYSDSGFNTVIDSVTGVVEGTNTTSWTVTVPLQDDTRYYWRARPHNGTHYEHWMPIGEFFINQSNQTPGNFNLVSPTNNSTVSKQRPKLEWSEPVDPDGEDFLTYTVEYSKYPSFREMKTITDIENTYYRFSLNESLERVQIYFWRVRVRDSSGAERLCNQTFSFFVKTDNLDKVRIYPNPAKQVDYITIENIVKGTTVKIFTISGELVCSLSEDDEDGLLIWDLKNENGNKVSSGIYLFQIEYEGQIRIIKAAVIR